MQLPRFLVSKDIAQRGISRLGTINTSYSNLTKVFGSPCLSESAGDAFDGLETVSWKIKFENGLIAEISDVGKFGERENYKNCNSWNIFGHSPEVLNYIKHYLKV